MKLIIPMAGMGKRMRPHSLTVPKPLIPVAGKPIVHHLIEDIAAVCDEPITEINFVVGRFGEETEKVLLKVAEEIGAAGKISYQDEALGTAHAILCADDSLSGKVIVAFADTLFKADFKLDAEAEGIIWTSKVENPEAFGVVQTDSEGLVSAFVEKPETFVSDRAIIGIYYFRDGERLHRELQRLIDEDIRIKGGEFGLTDALENMKNNGVQFRIDTVSQWLDCGNKEATVYTNQQVLTNKYPEGQVDEKARVVNSQIIQPCYIGPDVIIENSVIGPFVSIGRATEIKNAVISHSIIQSESEVGGIFATHSMIGNHVKIAPGAQQLSIGDYNQIC